jgi:hypothetical protein
MSPHHKTKNDDRFEVKKVLYWIDILMAEIAAEGGLAVAIPARSSLE